MLALWWQALPQERGAGGCRQEVTQGSAPAQGWEERGSRKQPKRERDAVMEGAQRRGIYVR